MNSLFISRVSVESLPKGSSKIVVIELHGSLTRRLVKVYYIYFVEDFALRLLCAQDVSDTISPSGFLKIADASARSLPMKR